MTRKALHAAVLVALVASAGCTGLFGGISDEQLCEDQTYDWNTSATVTYNLTAGGEYHATYDVEGNTTLELFRTDGIGNDRPLQIRSVKFRADDGTVYDCEDIEVETSRRRTTLELPEANGTFAYTASSTPKRFTTRTFEFTNGSYEVILPPGREMGNPLFGNVQPRGYEVDRSGERLRITWDSVESDSLLVQYYLERDITLFFGLVVVAGLGAVAGILYYYNLIRGLQRKREEAGLDVDVDDDEFDDDPPPGMR
jgi:hypothetical protein